MPRVRVKKVYFDKVRDEYPKVGAEFDVDEKRADVLVSAGVCEFVEDVTNEEAAAENESAREEKEEPTKETKKTTKKVKAETK